MTQGADGFIRVMLVLPFIRYVEQQGKSTKLVLKAMGLDVRMLQDPEATVHAEIVYGLCNALADLAGEPHLGCRIGEQLDLSRWSPVAEAARQSRTVGEFLCSYLMRIPQESSAVRHALTIEANRTTYTVRRLIDTRNPPIQVDGFGMSLHLRLLRMAVGDGWTPEHAMVETAFPEAVPRRYMDVRIARTENRELALSFPTGWLHAPLELDVALDTLPKKDSEPDLSIVAALRSAALPLLDNRSVGLHDLSEALGLQPKSLEAALRFHKTTVAREVKGLRIELAKEALVNTSQTVAEIGRSLGYEDQSHFARFFRSQTGFSPQQFRQSSSKDIGK
ncbi:helix-turn-helix domain-containing protein [Primorskyibacter sp. S87]|uniref:helix-turn-helix domain-containing protein n=1 Tax=Primorskyibacter sp. S87 TaxID=3415126 RepID=UPI003C7C749E